MVYTALLIPAGRESCPLNKLYAKRGCLWKVDFFSGSDIYQQEKQLVHAREGGLCCKTVVRSHRAKSRRWPCTIVVSFCSGGVVYFHCVLLIQIKTFHTVDTVHGFFQFCTTVFTL